MTEDLKTCTYCAEEIRATAIKCKHCGAECTGSEQDVLCRSELIQHLSRDIEILSNSVTNMRFRAVFVWCVGPFAVLGAFAFHGGGAEDLGSIPVLPAASCAFSWFALAATAGMAEREVGKKVNVWRVLMVRLATEEALSRQAVEESLADRHDSYKVVGFYLLFFGWVLLTFIGTVCLARWAEVL